MPYLPLRGLNPLQLKLFHDCKVALTSRICYPIRLVFHQHLNSHIAYPGIPNLQTTHEGNPPKPSNQTLALVCGLEVRVECQDRLCVNSDADETLANGIADM